MIPALAFISMFFQDVFGVGMMQFEALSLQLPERTRPLDYILGGWRAWRAAVFDQFGWMVGFTTTVIGVNAIDGHSWALRIEVIVAISIANLLGSRTGQELGIWSDRRGKKITLEARVASLEGELARLRSPAP